MVWPSNSSPPKKDHQGRAPYGRLGGGYVRARRDRCCSLPLGHSGPPLWLRPCPRQHRPCPQQRSHAASHAAARQRPPSRHQARQAGCQRCAPRKAIATCSSELRPPRAPPRRLRWHKKPCLVIPVPPIIHCPCFRHDSRAPPSSVRRKGRPAGAAVASQRRCELAAARVRLPRWQRAVRHS